MAVNEIWIAGGDIMRSTSNESADGVIRSRAVRFRIAIAVMVSAMLLAAAPVSADRYDSERAGHPVRIAAYILHPIGYAIDTLLIRPAHWLVSRRPLKTIFGHDD